MVAFEEYFAFVYSHELVEASDHYQSEEEEDVSGVCSQGADERVLPLGWCLNGPEQYDEHCCWQQ